MRRSFAFVIPLVATLTFAMLPFALGCASSSEQIANEEATEHQEQIFEVRRASLAPVENWQPNRALVGPQRIWIDNEPFLVTSDVIKAEPARDAAHQPTILLIFDNEAADRLERTTEDRIDQPIAIFLNGDLHTAPVVRGAVRNVMLMAGPDELEGEARAWIERLMDAE